MISDRILPNLTDSHTHLLHMSKKGIDVKDLIGRWQEAGGAWILDAGVDEENLTERLAFRENFPNLVYSAGIHPCDSGGNLPGRLEQIEAQLDHEAFVALGEIGLDYFWKDVASSIQKEFFEGQMILASQRELPVIIHNREADDDCFSILKKYNNNRGGIMHCYSSDYDFASKVLDLGFHISFAGNVTYKKSYNIQATAQRIPLDRLLIETDAPYLAPQKVRGKLNHPGYLGHTVDFIASLRGIPPVEIVDQSTSNFMKLFHLTYS